MVVSLAMPYNIDIFLCFMISDQNPPITPSHVPKNGLLFKTTMLVAVLLVIFYALLAFLWIRLPTEGVKLHGTVDIGVDLLGTKNDLFWFGGFGLAVFVVNMSLSLVMVKRERIASIYLVASTGIVFFLLICTMLFLIKLNRII